MTDATEKAIRSIAVQWRGGERTLAGKRASELIFEKGKKPNQNVLDELMKEAPGIENYLAAPGDAQPTAVDHSGNPLATDPQNKTDATGATNISNEEAREEQDEVDNRLKRGRKRAEKAADESRDLGGHGETKLNPDGSAVADDGSRPASGNAVSGS